MFVHRLKLPIFSGCVVAAWMLATVPVAAQASDPRDVSATQQKQPSQVEDRCDAASKAEAATKPETHEGAGTSPGNIGSTGWTGGTGGAHMGTSPQGALPDSPTWQPPTARGLDLARAAPPADTSAERSGEGC